MKTQDGFTLFENMKEVKTWLGKRNITRSITRLQVHHMYVPDYNTWEKTDKKVFSEPHLGRTKSLDDYGKRTWGYSDGHGHYIAQHFNVFPDGKITTGRHLNSKGIGIKGWNDGAIVIEIYGNFDKGHDTINKAQKEAVIGLYALLCNRFKITPSVNTIRYHCWFTAGGTYLGDYNASRSAKTCPGTGFFGGNTMAKMKANFLPLIKAYDVKNCKMGGEVEKVTETKVNQIGYVNTPDSTLNVRKSYDAESTKLGALKDNAKVEIVAKCSNGWLKIKYSDGYGYVNSKYINGIKDVVVEKPKPVTPITTYYRVVTGSYSDRDNAVEEKDKLVKLGYDAFLASAEVNGKTIYRVVADSFADKKDAEALIEKLKKQGYDPFISIYEK